MERYVTLRWRLTFAFVLVVLVPMLVGLLMVARTLPDAVQARQKAGVISATRLVGAVLQDYCDRAKTAAEAAGRAATAAGPADARAAAASLVSRGLADGIRVVGASDKIVAASGRVPAQPEDCGGEPSTGAAGPYLSAVVAFSTPQGRSAGSAVATFDASGKVLRRLQQAIGDADVVLVGSTGQVVAGTGTFTPQVIRDSFSDPPGTRRFGLVSSYLPASPSQAYGVIVLEPAAKGPALLVDGGAVVAIAVLLAIAIGVVSARATTQPLEELGDAAARIASGDLSTVIEVRSKDEVGRLAVAFNAMTDDLRGYVGQLEASRDELQSGLARLGDTLSSTHDLDRILNVVLESAMASTRASGGMVLLLTTSRDELVLAASRGVDVPLDLRLKVGDGVSGRVALSGDAVRGRVGDEVGELRPARGEPGATSLIAVPLKSSGTVIGVLDLYGSALPGGFDDNDLATIRTFASQATVAVDNVLLHEEAQRLSITDGLTGLWNYRYFTMTVGKEIERAARFGRPLALLMLDLDHFKDVNDTFGHQRGDAVLVELAGRIRGEVRDVDTVARYGGEEIVVVLPETDKAGAAMLAERICDAIARKPFGEPGAPPVHLTVSAGGAVFPVHGLAASVLLARADEALYTAKRAGRNTWRISSGASAPPASSVQLPD
ncbi:MAG: diguanylate cyclase with sensor [Frankiales bacterium]|nr:diguanylate cyclase with sensor [Frankiales bacterium]